MYQFIINPSAEPGKARLIAEMEINMIKIYNQYKHFLPAILFFIFYMTWFFWLENRPVSRLNIIHLRIDDYIPFCEWFILPYLLWFAYVAGTVLYFGLTEKDSYYSACRFLFTGMLLFLIISTLYPNGQNLRPEIMPRDNILTRLIQNLYLTDTPTNILPSIHVYNAVGVHLAVIKSSRLSGKKKLHAASFILCVLIVLSTVFIKQHSILDGVTALLLSSVMYITVYQREFLKSIKFKKPLAEPVSVHGNPASSPARKVDGITEDSVS